MITKARLEANRRNAQLSTGPRTAEGKEISRANALKHGLAGSGPVVAEVANDRVEELLPEWERALQPRDEAEKWLVRRIVAQVDRLDRCQAEEVRLADDLVQRSGELWDDHRRLAVEEIAAKLPRQPGVVVAKLRRSKHGCEWLLERWDALKRALDKESSWTDVQTSMALDLLGIPLAERGTPPWENDEERAELVALSIQELEERLIGALIELDLKERALARQGLEIEPGQATRTLRRYEQSCMSKLRWAWTRLDALKRNPCEASATTATAAAAIHAPSRPSPAATLPPPPPAPVAPTPSPRAATPPRASNGDVSRPSSHGRALSAPSRPNEPNENLGSIGGVERRNGAVSPATSADFAPRQAPAPGMCLTK